MVVPFSSEDAVGTVEVLGRGSKAPADGGVSTHPRTPSSPARWPTPSRPDRVHLVSSTSVPTNSPTLGAMRTTERRKASYWAGVLARNFSVVSGVRHSPTHAPPADPLTETLRGALMNPTSHSRRASMPNVPSR